MQLSSLVVCVEVLPHQVFLPHAPRGSDTAGEGQLPVHLPEMMQLEVAPLSKLSHNTEKHEHKK